MYRDLWREILRQYNRKAYDQYQIKQKNRHRYDNRRENHIIRQIICNSRARHRDFNILPSYDYELEYVVSVAVATNFVAKKILRMD
jgi:hypothetical protein